MAMQSYLILFLKKIYFKKILGLPKKMQRREEYIIKIVSTRVLIKSIIYSKALHKTPKKRINRINRNDLTDFFYLSNNFSEPQEYNK